jgi:EAL domain-containing protein (putative c-di-GMP-specific phosphodiesterase class I)
MSNLAEPVAAVAPKPAPCPRCEAFPNPVEGAGTLHVHFPLSHSLGKLVRSASDEGLEFTREGEVLSIRIGEVTLEGVLQLLASDLSSVEQRDARALFVPEGCVPTIANYLGAESFDTLVARAGSRWLREMVVEDRLTVLFHPIVRAGSGEVFAYECLMRGRDRDGSLVSPGRILDTARSAELLFQVDLAARRAAIREAARLGLTAKIFINFTPTSIYDPHFCLRTTVRAVQELAIAPQNVVFEVIESEHVLDLDHLRKIMDYYREQGFGVALDDLGSGYSSLNMLHELKPDYVKLDMGLVRDVHAHPHKALIAAKLLEVAQALGIRSVAEGIETPEERRWLEAHGADFLQGFHFAKPANPPQL